MIKVVYEDLSQGEEALNLNVIDDIIAIND